MRSTISSIRVVVREALRSFESSSWPPWAATHESALPKPQGRPDHKAADDSDLWSPTGTVRLGRWATVPQSWGAREPFRIFPLDGLDAQNPYTLGVVGRPDCRHQVAGTQVESASGTAII
jgi:hypothetical protein